MVMFGDSGAGNESNLICYMQLRAIIVNWLQIDVVLFEI